MHALLVAPLAPLPLVVSLPAPLPADLLTGISSFSRSVALYASDMPNNYRFNVQDRDQIEAWIAQGIERLGLEEASRRGRFLQSFNLLVIDQNDGPAAHAAYRQYFPSVRRISRAQSVTAMRTLTLHDDERTRLAAACVHR